MHHDAPVTRPILVGVTGGIGAGKSALVDALVERGAAAFSADAAVRDLYRTATVQSQVRQRWGDGVRAGADGSVDRDAIARIVFADEQERRWLESVLHPLVADAWDEFVDAKRAQEHPPRIIVAEVPLLFEAGLADRYDVVVVVTAPEQLRLARVEARGDASAMARQRAAVQMPERDKLARADVVLHNDGDRDALERFADNLAASLVRREEQA